MDASASPAAPYRSPVRVLAPYGLLLILALISPFLAPAAGPEEAFSLTAPALERARTAFAVRRARGALAAHRFREERWPERLEELVAGGALEAEALAEPRVRPYYYRDREGRGFVLAPEP
jgi:hypothetical protein